MSAVLLASIYCLALTLFLGLDIISRVPPTLYSLTLAGLGALSAVSVVGSLHVVGRPGTDGLAVIAAGLAGISAGAGWVAVGRLLEAMRRKDGKT